MLKRLLFFLSFFIFVDVHAQDDKAFIWEVSSQSTTVYLMGSIHFADSSFYPLRPEIEEAFDRAKYLVVELDISKIDDDKYNQLLLHKGVYKDGRTIRDVISDHTWRQLQQRLQHLDIAYESIKHYKPGVVVLTLSAVQIMRMGFDPELGIDAYFLAKASRSEPAKQIIELESLEQQLNLFIDVPDGELLLKESLYSLDEAETLMDDMVSFWKRGDVEQMNKLLFEEALDDYPAFSEIYDSLFYDRNRSMTTKIADLLSNKTQQREYYFVVVGSGHLIGDKGIVNALQKKGYNVRRL